MENLFLYHAFLMGIYITFVYDLFRILRRVIPHGNGLISLEDVCFWIYCGVEVFLLMYHESNGTLRWFAVMGAVLGMVLYGKCVSPLLVKYAALLIRWILHTLARFLHILSTPFRIFLKKQLTYLQKVLRIIVRSKRHNAGGNRKQHHKKE